MHPYRSRETARAKPERRALFDRDLAGVYLVLWVIALVRVAIGIILHQRFGVELTMATGAVCLLPLLARA